MIDLGMRIKRLREMRNMNQAALASRAGITKSSVSAYENGTRLPSYDVLVRLAEIFHVSTDYLLGREKLHTIDAQGLSPEQIDEIQRVVTVYQQYNRLNQQQKGQE